MEYKQLGSYGILKDNNKLLVIKKFSGPYDSKYDLPGGTIEINETPSVALVREFKEETNLDIKKFDLVLADSVTFEWKYDNKDITVFHTGIIYEIKKYYGSIEENIEIDNINDDSLGCLFINIEELNKDNLSNLAYDVLFKLGIIK